MGDMSIIARRLPDKCVQYGWSGKEGGIKTLGTTLLRYYDDPKMVEYLFGLGQVRSVREPYSEQHESGIRTVLTGRAHWIGDSERWMFSKLLFVNYGYFYDFDDTWYYVEPGRFCIKVPLTLVAENLSEESGHELDFMSDVEHMIIDRIVNHWYRTDEDFRVYLQEKGYDEVKVMEMAEELASEDYPAYRLFDWYRPVFDYFDDWVVVRATEDGRKVGGIVMRKKETPHVETIFWGDEERLP